MACDTEEFTRVFNEIYPQLCRFLECLLAGQCPAPMAEEIAQESFLNLYRTGFDRVPGNEARFWLYRVARNMALNELSKSNNRGRLFEKVIDLFRARQETPEEIAEQSERKTIVWALIKSLPEHQRAALLLREQDEMSYSDIATVLQVTEGKVKVDIFRARTALRAKNSEGECLTTGTPRHRKKMEK